MLKQSDREYVRKRKKVWNQMGFTYRGIGDLSQNGSLNCGCWMCRMKTYERRRSNKIDRLDSRTGIKNLIQEDQ